MSDKISEGQESIELAKNIRWGLLLGTPLTFVFFFSLLVFSGVSLHRAFFAATWTAIVGGTFYGGLTGLLKFSLKHD